MTLYDHLGVSPFCTSQEIRAAFEARKAHLEAARICPQSPALRARVEVEWRAIHAAWDIVGHPVRRRAYNQQLGLNSTLPHAPTKLSYRGMVATLLVLIAIGVGLLAPLPLLVAGGSIVLAATLWWVAAPGHRH